jgi:hypothetical protein
MPLGVRIATGEAALCGLAHMRLDEPDDRPDVRSLPIGNGLAQR